MSGSERERAALGTRRTAAAPRSISRAEFLKYAAVMVTSAAVGCTPLRVVTKSYPKRYDNDRDLVGRTLRAFVDAIIPGAPLDEPNLVKAFGDPNYPFYKIRGFFVSDLNARARKAFRKSFESLSRAERTGIVRNALDGGPVTSRLYRGAILLTQVSFYAGIYDDAGGCPLIDFRGASGIAWSGASATPVDRALLAAECTSDGNPR